MNHLYQQIRFALTLVFTLSLCVLSSCVGQQKGLDNYNFFGGKTRTNGYEWTGTFSASLTFQEQTRFTRDDKTTKLVGASSLAIPLTFTISYIPTSDGFVTRVMDKTVEWRSPLDSVGGSRAVIAAMPCSDKEDTFYGIANDGALYAFARDGKRRWKLPLFPNTASTLYSDVLIVTDGIVAGVSGNEGGEVVKVGFDGKILWRQASMLAPTKTFAADDKENILVGFTNETFGATDSLVLFAPNGKRLWSKALESTRLLRMTATLGTMGFATGLKDSGNDRTPTLFAFNLSTGALLWQRLLLVTPTGIAVSTVNNPEGADTMIVIAGSKIGIADPMGAVMAFSTQGKELWRKGFELQVVSTPMVSKENIAFIGKQGTAVGIYYVKKDGTFGSVFSISDMPAMLLQPAIDYDANMVFATTDALGIVRVGRSPAQKLLPY